MSKAIDAEEVQRLLESEAQLVEVLPSQEYEEQHIAGAVSIPLKELDERFVSRLDRKRPVVVYCWDSI